METSQGVERRYKDLLWQNRDRHSGDICFYGTRIPVAQFFDGMESGESIDEFEAAFPQIGRARLVAVLRLGLSGLADKLEAA